MVYLHDASATLALFTSCCPEGAGAMAAAEPRLLTLLGEAHEGTLAATAELARRLEDEDRGSKLQHVAACTAAWLQSVVWQLLRAAFLDPHAATAAPSERSGPSSASSSSSARAPSPESRGEALMTSLMALAGPTDDGSENTRRFPHLLPSIARRYELERWLAHAALSGSIFLDDDQFDYVLLLCGGPAEDGAEGRLKQARSAAAAVSTASASKPAGRAQSAEASALEASLVSQIRDLLGDTYGDGFLLVCIAHFNGNAEAVINALLEGSLPPSLQRLDPKAKTRPAMDEGSSAASSSAPAPAPGPSPVPASGPKCLWLAAYAGLEPRTSPFAHVASRPAPGPVPSTSTSGPSATLVNLRSRKMDRKTARVLDSADRSIKKSAVRYAEVSPGSSS